MKNKLERSRESIFTRRESSNSRDFGKREALEFVRAADRPNRCISIRERTLQAVSGWATAKPLILAAHYGATGREIRCYRQHRWPLNGTCG